MQDQLIILYIPPQYHETDISSKVSVFDSTIKYLKECESKPLFPNLIGDSFIPSKASAHSRQQQIIIKTISNIRLSLCSACFSSSHLVAQQKPCPELQPQLLQYFSFVDFCLRIQDCLDTCQKSAGIVKGWNLLDIVADSVAGLWKAGSGLGLGRDHCRLGSTKTRCLVVH